MDLFNPHDAAKKEPPPDPVPAACIWEALRHNATFRQDVDAIREAGTTRVPGHDNIALRVHQQAHVYARLCLHWLVPATLPEECRVMREPALSLSQAWPNTPEWFRTFFARTCSGDLTLPAPTKKEGDPIVRADWADQLIVMLSEPNGVTTVQLLLHHLKGRLVVLPDAICRSRAEEKVILEQIRPLLKKVHGHKHLYPSRSNWDCFLEFSRGMMNYGQYSYACGSVIRKFVPIRWKGMLKKNKASGKDGELLAVEEELGLLREDVLELVEQAKPGVIGQVEVVERFIYGYYPAMKPA